MSQADWLHLSETQSVDTASGQFLNWQASFKPASFFKALQRHALGVKQSLVEGRVLLFIKRTINVIVASFVIAGSAKGDIQINGIRGDYGSDSVVKIELVAARKFHYRRSQGFGRERTSRDDGDVSLRDVFDFFTNDTNEWFCFNAFGDQFGKGMPIDSQRCTCRDTCSSRSFHHE